MSMTKVYFDKVLSVIYPNQHEMMLACARVSEYYESPYPTVKGVYITWAEWLEAYADLNGELKFFTEWEGFNVPARVMKDWDCQMTIPAEGSKQEHELINVLYDFPEVEYVIMSLEDDTETLNHELAHGLYATNKQYKEAVLDALHTHYSGSFLRGEVFRDLVKAGYENAVPYLIDEWQAYMVAGGKQVFSGKLFNELGNGEVIQAIFNEFVKEKEDGRE